MSPLNTVTNTIIKYYTLLYIENLLLHSCLVGSRFAPVLFDLEELLHDAPVTTNDASITNHPSHYQSEKSPSSGSGPDDDENIYRRDNYSGVKRHYSLTTPSPPIPTGPVPQDNSFYSNGTGEDNYSLGWQQLIRHSNDTSPSNQSASSMSDITPPSNILSMSSSTTTNSTNTDEDDPDKSTKRLSKASTRVLTHWLVNHRENPYPTLKEKKFLAKQSNLTCLQVYHNKSYSNSLF